MNKDTTITLNWIALLLFAAFGIHSCSQSAVDIEKEKTKQAELQSDIRANVK